MTRPPGHWKPSRRELFPWPGVLEVPLPEEPGAAPGPQPAGSRPLTTSSSRRPQRGLLPWATAGHRWRAGLQQHLLLVCRPRPRWEPGPRVRGSGEWTPGGVQGGGPGHLAGRSQGTGLSCAWAPRAPPSTRRLQGQPCKRVAGDFRGCVRPRAHLGPKDALSPGPSRSAAPGPSSLAALTAAHSTPASLCAGTWQSLPLTNEAVQTLPDGAARGRPSAAPGRGRWSWGGCTPTFTDHPASASLPSRCGQAVWAVHGFANTWNGPFLKFLPFNLVPDAPSLGFNLQTSSD